MEASTSSKMSTPNPAEPPPSYEQTTGRPSHLQVPQSRNGISPAHRRSMEDEQRPLPDGWIRQYDQETHHQFFVDTRADPPRSIWSHPYDDETYLKSLSPAERDKVTRLHHSVSLKDIAAESSDDEAGFSAKEPKRGGGIDPAGPSTTAASSSAAPKEPPPKGLQKYGRKLKDRVTGSTHEERQRDRDQRAREEQQAYDVHMKMRQAMSRAMQTGQPQYLAKDSQGRDVYVEPPNGPTAPAGARGYNPYATGVYANPNARFIRPDYPYNRPYGYGYGGGYGFPLFGGALLGGALLGGLLF